MSLRAKFILALLVSSLAAVALVGLVANHRLMQKFDAIVAQTAARDFRDVAAAYIGTYGSWDAAQAHEPFPRFAERRRDALGRPAALGLAVGERPPPPGAGHDAGLLPPPPPDGAPERAHLPGPGDLASAPFRFLLFDPQGRVLLGPSSSRDGDTVRDEDRADALPVTVDGQIVAYASPHGAVSYSALDLGYIAAMREALLWGIGAAAILAVVLGLAFGNRLSSALQRLTHAVRDMEAGRLDQQVKIDAQDEVGELARAFNLMSEELARSHAALQDSNARIQAQADQLRELSVRDALTQLHNRRHFDEHASHLCALAQRGRRPLSVMVGDIDHFKLINDGFSHAVGDAVLRQVGELLRAHTRASDLVARYGGEEFVVAFPDTSLADARALCEKLRGVIAAHPWQRLHPGLQVTISIGVAAATPDDSLDSLLRMADDWLYRAKSDGRNCVRAAA